MCGCCAWVAGLHGVRAGPAEADRVFVDADSPAGRSAGKWRSAEDEGTRAGVGCGCGFGSRMLSTTRLACGERPAKENRAAGDE